MKTIVAFISMVLITVSCHSGRRSKQPTIEYPPRDISHIGIKYIHGSDLFLISVSCEEFETLYDIRYQKLTDTFSIAKIMYLIDESPVDTIISGIDTRRQLDIYWKGGAIETICFGGPIFQRNGTLYRGSDELVEAIEFLLPEEYWYLGMHSPE